MLSRTTVVCVGLLSVVLAGRASAQSALAGVVKDDSGGAMPGVTVEAKSAALIEGVRVATTDDQGQYRIVDLRPGLYQVTFTMPGFSVVTREGIELRANFTAPITASGTSLSPSWRANSSGVTTTNNHTTYRRIRLIPSMSSDFVTVNRRASVANFRA